MEFQSFAKIPRLSRECIVTEKIDGTNGQLYIIDPFIQVSEWTTPQDIIQTPIGSILVGSRNRWLSEKEDNHGFFKWTKANAEQLITELGPGRHFGEWWGQGINKRYPNAPKSFSLFNASRWQPAKDEGKLALCQVVPILYTGIFETERIGTIVNELKNNGSVVWPWAKAEGIVIFHSASRTMFKVTCENDEKPKGSVE